MLSLGLGIQGLATSVHLHPRSRSICVLSRAQKESAQGQGHLENSCGEKRIFACYFGNKVW